MFTSTNTVQLQMYYLIIYLKNYLCCCGKARDASDAVIFFVFIVYSYCDLKGFCSNVTETRHLKIVGACGPKSAKRSPTLNPTSRTYLRVRWIRTLFYPGSSGKR